LKIFPCLNKGKTTEEHEGFNENLMHQERNRSHSKKKKFAADPDEKPDEIEPLNQLGFGIVAYKDLMFTMTFLFTIISLLMIPTMVFYSNQSGIPEPKNFATLSLGNFGYSSIQCQSNPYNLLRIPIKCPYGSVGEDKSIGVIPGSYKD
jgi:hypothetical protein